MKVNRISEYKPNTFGNKSNLIEPQTQFLYLPNENKSKYSLKEHKLEYFGGFLACIAAIFALSNFFINKNPTPKKIVELADKTIGLNKINKYEKTTKQIKEQILYPIKSVNVGVKRILKGDFKTGLIVGANESNEAVNYLDAFIEHAKALKIKCFEIEKSDKKNYAKEIHKILNKAIAYHKETGECVIVNIGDMKNAGKMLIGKTKSASNIEKRLEKMPHGVLWTGWTNDTKNLPYFYNNTQTLSVKLMN